MLLLALAFHAGMLAIASPCILPVLPFAGNQGDTEERNQSKR
jgi:cytochrome c biogenesis protein CcdA